MTTTQPPQRRGDGASGLRASAVLLASLVFPLPLLVGRVVELIMDGTNPAGLTELDAGLAYLTEILSWSFGSLGLVVVAFLTTVIVLWAKERAFRAVRLPLLVFAVQLVAGIAILIVSGAVESLGG